VQSDINGGSDIGGRVTGDQDIRLAASLAGAWCQLPEELRAEVWPASEDASEDGSLYSYLGY
jgi:hypothetical protein